MLERIEKIENDTFPTFQLPTLSVRIYDTYNYKYFYIDKPKTADYYIGGLDNGCFGRTYPILQKNKISALREYRQGSLLYPYAPYS